MRLPDTDTGIVSCPQGWVAITNKTTLWRRIAYLGVKSNTATASILVELDEQVAFPAGSYLSDRHNLFTYGNPDFHGWHATANNPGSVGTGGQSMNLMEMPEKIIWWPPGYTLHIFFGHADGGTYRLMYWNIPQSTDDKWANDLTGWMVY